MKRIVILCKECADKDLAGELSTFFQDYTEYYCSTGEEFAGCDHLFTIEKEVK